MDSQFAEHYATYVNEAASPCLMADCGLLHDVSDLQKLQNLSEQQKALIEHQFPECSERVGLEVRLQRPGKSPCGPCDHYV